MCIQNKQCNIRTKNWTDWIVISFFFTKCVCSTDGELVHFTSILRQKQFFYSLRLHMYKNPVTQRKQQKALVFFEGLTFQTAKIMRLLFVVFLLTSQKVRKI